MFSALNTKLLIVIIALLTSIASYLAWQKHQIVAEQQQMSRPMRPDEKTDEPGDFRLGEVRQQTATEVVLGHNDG